MKIENITLNDLYDAECTKNMHEKGENILFALHIGGHYYKSNRDIMYLSHDTVKKIIEDARKYADDK
jgi:hypothetical protein